MAHSGGTSGDNADLRRTYVLVFIVEAVVIAGLYWLGRIYA